MEWKNMTVTRIGQELLGSLCLSGLTRETKLIGYLRGLIERNWLKLLWGCKSKIQGQVGRLESLSEVVAANFGFYSHKGINSIGFQVHPNPVYPQFDYICKGCISNTHISDRHEFFRVMLFRHAQSFYHCLLIIVGLRQRKKYRIMKRAESFDTEIPGLKSHYCLTM